MNFILSILVWFRYWLGITKLGKYPSLSGYTATTILDCTNTHKGHEWGDFHENNHTQYWAPTCVKWAGNKVQCAVKYAPQSFVHVDKYLNKHAIIIPWATGVVRSIQSFMYGYFQATIKFPIANGQWPAFWLTSSIGWPPEIDIVEGYSKGDSYGAGQRLQSNIHYREEDNGPIYRIKAVNHPVPLKLLDTEVIVGMLWTPDKVEFYYNGYLVRRVTDKKVLSRLNTPMVVILNSAIQMEHHPNESVTTFKNVQIWQKQQ